MCTFGTMPKFSVGQHHLLQSTWWKVGPKSKTDLQHIWQQAGMVRRRWYGLLGSISVASRKSSRHKGWVRLEKDKEYAIV